MTYDIIVEFYMDNKYWVLDKTAKNGTTTLTSFECPVAAMNFALERRNIQHAINVYRDVLERDKRNRIKTYRDEYFELQLGTNGDDDDTVDNCLRYNEIKKNYISIYKQFSPHSKVGITEDK